MIRYLISLMAMMMCGIAHAQYPSLEWAGAIGGDLYDKATSVAVDDDENVYLVGSFDIETLGSVTPGPIDLDPGAGVSLVTSNGGEDIFIVKLDVAGSLIWGHALGGAYSSYVDEGALSIELSEAGNVFVMGHFFDSVDFDPGPGVEFLTPITGTTFLLKLDDQGEFIWAKNFGNGIGQGAAIAKDMVIDQDENVYTTGLFFDTVDFDPGIDTFSLIVNSGVDYFVQKLDSTGQFIWASSNAINNVYASIPSAIDVDDFGNVVVTGHSTNDSSDVLNPIPCNDDIFIDKWDSLGNVYWHYIFDSGLCGEAGYDVNIDEEGGIYTTGYYNGTIDFDPGVGVVNSTAIGSQAVFILKLNAFGDYEWVKSYSGFNSSTGEGYGKALAIDSLKNVYLTGYVCGLTDFDPSPDSAQLTDQAFLLKLDSVGNFVWVVENPVANDIQVDQGAKLYLGGATSLMSDFDPNTGVFYLANGVGGDAFIQKLGQCADKTNETIVACQSYYCPINDSTYYTNTITHAVLTNIYGCDSVIEQNITILPIDLDLSFSGLMIQANQANATYQWVDCNAGYAPIPGADAQDFIPIANGSYAVIITTNTCSDTSDCIAIIDLGIEDQPLEEVYQVFPNPIDEQFNIWVDPDNLIERVSLYDLTGQLLMSYSNINQSEFSHRLTVASGIYFFEIVTNRGQQVVQVVKS